MAQAPTGADEAAPPSASTAAAPARGAAPESYGLPPGYKVEKVWIWQESSDCLWNIAKEHYGNPRLWPKIYEANRQLIKDPNKIFPKQRIVIPPLGEEGVIQDHNGGKP